MRRNNIVTISALFFILLPAAAIWISSLRYDQNWHFYHQFIIVIVLGGMTVLSMFTFLISTWLMAISSKKGGYKFISFVITVVALAYMLLASFITAFINVGFNDPILVNTQDYPELKVKVYIYEKACFPPDAKTECDDYTNYIYYRNYKSPIMHLFSRYSYEITEIKMLNSEVLWMGSRWNNIIINLKDREVLNVKGSGIPAP